MDTNFQPVIERRPRGKYRQHSLEFKRTLVEMAMQPGVSVARLAREHGVNANQVFSWRKLYEAGQLVGGAAAPGSELLPVVVTTPAQQPEAEPAPAGIITLEIVHLNPEKGNTLNSETEAEPLTLKQAA